MTSSDRRLAPRGGPRPDRALERDACGIGFVADVTGRTDRRVVELGLQGLARLRHRGAFAADEQTGDGAGVLFPIPRRLIGHAVGATPTEASQLGLLMLFICDKRSPGEVCAAVEDALGRERLRVVRWRDVPVDPSALGDHARDTRPRILQAVLRAPSADDAARSEQRAHRARRRIDAFARAADRDVYVASCSFATVTYKALAAADRLAAFYPDLLDPDVEAPFIVFHQRYSTNTAPTWERAQPFRMLCHNGEINTIAGNANRMHAREGRLGLATLAEEALFRPAIDDAGSDSAILDETVEILTKEGGARGAGRDIRRAIAMVVPAAWEDAPDMDHERRGFYRWHSSLMEPWDGPAALIFTDGVAVGAALDRNGLRPLRYLGDRRRPRRLRVRGRGRRPAGGTRATRQARAGADDRGRSAERRAGRRRDPRRGERRAVGRLGGGASDRAAPRDASRRVPAIGRARDEADPARLHARGPEHDDPAGRRAREGAHVLDGRRHADRGAQPPRPLDLQPPATAVRAGDEPRDGPSARTVGDVARRPARPAGAALERRAERRRAGGVRELLPVGATVGSAVGRHVAGRTRRRRTACRAPAARLRGGGRGRRRRADPGGERRRRRTRSSTDPLRARRGGGERRADERRPADALLDRGRGGRRARVASRRVSPRRRRRGGPAPARRRHGRRALARRR